MLLAPPIGSRHTAPINWALDRGCLDVPPVCIISISRLLPWRNTVAADGSCIFTTPCAPMMGTQPPNSLQGRFRSCGRHQRRSSHSLYIRRVYFFPILSRCLGGIKPSQIESSIVAATASAASHRIYTSRRASPLFGGGVMHVSTRRPLWTGLFCYKGGAMRRQK